MALENDSDKQVLQCSAMIKKAGQSLLDAKKDAHKSEVYFNWAYADDALQSAVTAQNQHDYALCVSKAQSVIKYIEQDQYYLKWKRSLSE